MNSANQPRTNGTTAQEGTMKKTTLFVLALLAALFTAAPVQASTAFPVTQSTAYAVTQNTDIDQNAELIIPTSVAAADFPSKCARITVTNTLATGDVVYIAYLDNTIGTLSTTAAASLTSWGWPLYPVATSGATSKTIELTDQNGKLFFVNPRKVYAAAGGINSSVALACDGIR